MHSVQQAFWGRPQSPIRTIHSLASISLFSSRELSMAWNVWFSKVLHRELFRFLAHGPVMPWKTTTATLALNPEYFGWSSCLNCQGSSSYLLINNQFRLISSVLSVQSLVGNECSNRHIEPSRLMRTTASCICSLTWPSSICRTRRNDACTRFRNSFAHGCVAKT